MSLASSISYGSFGSPLPAHGCAWAAKPQQQIIKSGFNNISEKEKVAKRKKITTTILCLLDIAYAMRLLVYGCISAHKGGLVAFLIHQPRLSHCPAHANAAGSPRSLPCEAENNVYHLLKGNADTDFGGIEHILAVDSDDFTLFDARKLPLFFGQVGRAREIQFHNMPKPNGRRQRKLNENTRFAHVTASAIKKPISLRHPDAYGPRESASAFLTLLY